jgi:lactate permease
MMPLWQQSYSIGGQNLFVSALIAALPILLLLFLLGVRRRPAWEAALAGFGATVLLAVAGYGMSFRHTASSAAYGAAFGLFPITWIVFWAISLYRITVETGQFEIIRQSIGAITTDMRLQILLIAFAFGAFLEGGAGFGTPVAVAAGMMTGLGFSAFYASSVCLLANTAPVAFGAIGTPVITLAGITGLPVDQLSADVGRICAPISFLLPAYLIATATGMRGVWEVWPAVLTCGVVFAGVQFGVSNFIGAQLTDILSSLSAIVALVALLRFWRPASIRSARDFEESRRTPKPASSMPASMSQPSTTAAAVATATTLEISPALSAARIVTAWSPYILLVLFVLVWGLKPVQQLLNSVSVSFPWPWLHNEIQRMPPVITRGAKYGAMYNLNWLAAPGTSCMLSAVCAALLLRMKPGAFIKLLGAVAKQLFRPTVTVTAVLAMAFVMNYCGATGTLGLAFAATGMLFPFFSSLLGWLGVFLTGSDTSANALFGNLQVVTAQRLGLPPVLLAAANSAGGVMGKMISIQTIAVAAAATGLSTADQSKLFRFTLKHSIILASAVGGLVLLYTYVFRIS